MANKDCNVCVLTFGGGKSSRGGGALKEAERSLGRGCNGAASESDSTMGTSSPSVAGVGICVDAPGPGKRGAGGRVGMGAKGDTVMDSKGPTGTEGKPTGSTPDGGCLG